MKFLTILALTAPLAMSTSVFADGAASSVYQHQTDAGKIEVTPALTFGSIKNSYNTNNNADGISSTTDSVFILGVGAEYGINEMFSLGIRLGYETDNISYSPSGNVTSTKGSGLVDPAIYLNGRSAVGPGSLRYGANLSMALGNSTISSSGNSTNEYTGGTTFTPFVGYEMAAGPGTAGARLAYDLYQSDRNITTSVPNEPNFKISKGNNLGLVVFYEMNFQPLIWGVDVGVNNHSATTFKGANNSVGDQDGFTSYKIETYGSYAIATDITLLPTIGYGTVGQGLLLGETQGATGSGGLYATVAARFGF